MTGLSLVEAGALARRFQVRLGVILVNSSEDAPGTVLDQTPDAGGTLAAGDTLLVRVAREPRRVAVPDLTLLTESDAISLLLDAGLTPGTRTTRIDDEVPAGRVISSDPVGGSLVAPDTAVSWVVSEGAVAPTASPRPTLDPAETPRTARIVTVPDVEGLPEADALEVLLEAGLEPGNASMVPDPGLAAGIVVRTDPTAGVRVLRGTAIDYSVSTGAAPAAASPSPNPTPSPSPSAIPTPSPSPSAIPKPSPSPSAIPTPSPSPSAIPTPTAAPTVALVTVPDVSGLDESSARSELENAGLVPGDVVLRASRGVAAGSVIRTVPAAGEDVQAGTSVQLVVSLGLPSPAPSPSAIPTASPSPIPVVSPSASPAVSEMPAVSASPGASQPAAEALARVLGSGVLRVNVAPDAPPWSSLTRSGRQAGFDPQVARRIAERLGVEVEFTTFPTEEVLAGAWDDRWDIALGHLLASDDRAQVLQLSRPYAWDEIRIAVSDMSGLTPEDMAGRALCVAVGSPLQGWLEGTLQLLDVDGLPALPPEGALAVPSATDGDCLEALLAGTVDGWLGSGPTILAAQEGDPSILASEPVAIAPVVVATGLSGSPDPSLQQAVDAAITTIVEEGVLTRPSRRFLGDVYTVPPPAEEAPQPSGEGAPPSVEEVLP